MTELNADWAEEAFSGGDDNVVPTRGYQTLPTVALGGSAGCVPALQQVLRAMPSDCGMAFVVIVHLAPEHDSTLADMLQKVTPLRVVKVTESQKVEANSVYVIPQGHALRMLDGQIQLAELTRERGRHVAIDLFFRTLADTCGPHAAAVVLSGADSDGAVGIKRIKERGGLAIAQDPDEAEVASMPRAAIATGVVDWVLPVAEIPQHLIEYRRLERQLKLPPEEGPHPAVAERKADDIDEAALRDVLAFLRTRTGRDFAAYKRATIVRRIARRMQVTGVRDLPAYLACLRTQPGEAGALLQDLLISVTNFFRDAECFTALQTYIPTLFRGKGPGDRVRVWVAACASGEEAYSIAILLAEHAATLDAPPAIQVFATDLDEQAIQAARSGSYPATIEADVSAERLHRFFVREHNGYRVRRDLRETVLFACHDLLKDSPFSRVDLVSCRNLLIYLSRNAQTRLMQTFHFALRPGARLFLGSSETVEEGDPLFSVLDKKHRIYIARPNARAVPPMPIGPGALAFALGAAPPPKVAPVVPGAPFDRPADHRATSDAKAAPPAAGDPASWPELHFRLLEQLGPPSLIIDREHEIVHLSEKAGQFLHIRGGEPTSNLLRLVPPVLRIELRAAVFQAAQSGAGATIAGAAIDVGGERHEVTVRVSPVDPPEPEFFLVVFDPQGRCGDGDAAATGERGAHPDPVAEQLDREVERLKARLLDTVEQYEASTEELKASNEELQAMNEELRSATEELETGREELQSINEELTTVNSELKSKVDELATSNTDMLNLMDATAIPTVFLDRDLLITRYTPAATTVFNLIPSDVGRPLTDLRNELDFPTLGDDAARVLQRLEPVEREIGGAGGRWYSARLLPYRTAEGRIGGAVLTLVDITGRRATEMALRASQERLRLIVENAREYAIFSFDPGGRVTSWNPGAERLLGYSEGEVLGKPADLVFTQEDLDAEVPEREMETALATGRAADDRFHRRKDGSRFWASGMLMPMHDAAGATVGFVKILRDQTEERRNQEAQDRSRGELLQAWHENEGARREAELQKEHLASLFTQAPAPICILRGPSYIVEFANAHMCQLWGRAQEEVIGKPVFEAVQMVRGTVIRGLLDSVLATGTPQTGKEVSARLDRKGDGTLEDAYLNFTYAPLRDVAGRIDGVLAMASDVTDEVRAREQMSELHEMEQAASRAKDDFLAMLGHELRNPLAPLRTSLYLIRKRMPPSPADSLLDIADRQAGNLSRIVDDLLEAARIGEGKIDLRLERIDLGASVRQALEASQGFLNSQQHQVNVTLPKRGLYVNADPVRIEQIVLNLLNNAGKYTPAGGRIDVGLKRVGKFAELRVADNGIGIPEELRPRLFQIFQQGNRDLAREEGGLGVGLNVVRRLVDLHGGSVHALSEGPGKGSEFVVRLPIAAEVHSASEAEPPDAPVAKNAAPRRVLVVDDNRDAGETLAMLIDSLGHETRIASDGPTAVRLADEWSPDIVFLDIGLPGMDGYEVAREIRLRHRDQPPRLVAVTGYGQDRDREKTRDAGFDEHLVKPADFKAIAAMLAALEAESSDRAA